MYTDLLTIQEVADLLHVDSSTIRRYIKQGKIPAHYIDKWNTPPRIVRILRKDIDFLFKTEDSK